MLTTMSNSVAPSARACCVSATFVAVDVVPCGKPITVPTATPCAGEALDGVGDVGRPDADAEHTPFGGDVELCIDGSSGQFGLQDRVVQGGGKIALGNGGHCASVRRGRRIALVGGIPQGGIMLCVYDTDESFEMCTGG